MAGWRIEWLVACGVAFALSVQPAAAISLKEAIEKALTEHPQVGAAREALTANEYRLDQSNAALLPTVDLDADVGKQFVDRPGSLSDQNNARWWLRRQAMVTGRLVLFDGWQRANAIYRDAAQVDAAARKVIEQSEAMALSVIEAYIDHRRHHFLLTIADQNIAKHESIRSLIETRLAGGQAAQSELDQVNGRLYAAKSVRAEILQAAYEADAKFKAAVGAEPRDTHPVPYPAEMPLTLVAAVDLAEQYNPALAARAAEASALDYEYERRKSEIFPTVSLEGSAKVGHDLDAVPGRNDDYQVKLRLTWQLYDGGLRSARVGEASANAAEARLKRDLAQRELVKTVEATFGKLVATKLRLDALDQRVAASLRVVDSYQREYEASKRSLLDLLDAENSVFSSRFEQASVSGVRLFSAYYLKALTGTLLASFGLTPPVATIDFDAINPIIGLPAPPKIEPLR